MSEAVSNLKLPKTLLHDCRSVGSRCLVCALTIVCECSLQRWIFTARLNANEAV